MNGSASRLLWALATLAVLLFALVSRDADARPRPKRRRAAAPAAAAPGDAHRIVLLNFSGPQGKRAQGSFYRLAVRKYVVLPQAVFQRTARALHVTRGDSDDVANIARKLGADAIVGGRVHRQAGKWVLTVVVHDGASGNVVGEPINVELRGPKMDRRALVEMNRALFPLLEKAQAATTEVSKNDGEKPGADDENPDGAKPAKPKGGGEVEPAAEKVASEDPTGDALGTGGKGEGDGIAKTPDSSTTSKASPPQGARPPWRPLIELGVGVGGTGRSLSFAGNQIMNLQGYSGGLVAAMDLSLDAWPLAGSSGALRGLGLYLTLDKVISVSSTLRRTNMPDRSLDSSELMFTIGGQWGFRFRDAQDASTLGLRFGYGLTTFEIAVPQDLAMMDAVSVPDVSYKYLDAGAFLKVPFSLGSTWCEFGLRGSYLPVLSGGQITSGGRVLSMGPSIGGNGSASGFEGASGLKIALKSWFNIQGNFKLDYFTTSFDMGAKATSATDLYYTFGGGIGVEY